MKPRLDFIDFLRFLGITLIVLAHVYPPFALLQLRSFDVPLMIFVSGLSYGGRQIQPSLKSYYGPRIKRLVIPSYIFLTFYFSLISLFHVKLNYMGVIKSYLFLNNGTVSYMWIIRIFLLIMLITPFLVRMSNQIKLFYLFVISIIILLIQEILCLFSMDNLFLNEIYQYVVRPKKGYEHRYNAMQLRTIQDWIVRRQLLGTEGVAVTVFSAFSSFNTSLKSPYRVLIFS